MSLNKILSPVLCAFLLLALSFTGCSPGQDRQPRELLCYCGITMEAPMRELALLLEQENNCVIKFIIGASGDLFHMLSVNQVGDLYLPGSESYIKQAEQAGFVADTVEVGFKVSRSNKDRKNPVVSFC